jgi:predicted protein tyrosine phosphatase
MPNPKKVNFFSLQVAQSIGVPVNMISIGEDDSPKPVFEVEHKRLLRLEFDDIEEDIGGAYVVFDFIHATKILRFIAECNGEDIVVHCAAGISRSAAVAKFLEDELGYTVVYTPFTSGSGLSMYNKEVYRVLRLAHMNKILGE